MTQNQRVTAWVIFAATVLLLGYDVYAFLHGGVDATISWVIWDQSHVYPVLPFAMGCLCGHLFAQMIFKKKKLSQMEKS